MKKPRPIADEPGWQTLHEDPVFQNSYVQVTTQEVLTPSRPEKPIKWTVVHRKPAVVIAPLTADGRLLLVRQERIPIRVVQWEFPAGQIDEENAGDAAVVRATALRELSEETGYELGPDGELIGLGLAYSSPGFTDEYCHLFVARGVVLSGRGTALEEGEGIVDCRAFAPADFRRLTLDGEVNDSHTLALYGRMLARRLID